MRRSALAALCLALTACGTAARPAGEGTTPAPSDGLPAAVSARRDQIVRAARAMDHEALGRLLDPATFSYSFGDSGDPVGYWRDLESDAHVPVLGDILPAVLGMRSRLEKDTYVWPHAFGLDPSDWSAEDREEMRALYPEEDISRFEGFGGYTGWRAGIRQDGTWLYFVAGD